MEKIKALDKDDFVDAYNPWGEPQIEDLYFK
jgi:hypothetical protein